MSLPFGAEVNILMIDLTTAASINDHYGEVALFWAGTGHSLIVIAPPDHP